MENIIRYLDDNNVKYNTNVELSKITSYKVGGKARLIIYPSNEKELVEVLKKIDYYRLEFKVIGNCTNLLFSDELYTNVLINLSKMNEIKFLSNNKVKVGAGVNLLKLSLMCAKKDLTGLEFASGIPGNIGGAIYMNAGAYKSDMGYIVKSVRVLTDRYEIITLVNKEMDFHYRTSFLQKHKDYICLGATLQLKKGKREAIEEVIRERRLRREESQPLEYPSCGSVFRNPEGDFAGRLIEEAGLKGKTIGGAKESEKHANFIVNFDNATAKDIHDLIELVHDTVLKKFKVDLKCEQEFVNWE